MRRLILLGGFFLAACTPKGFQGPVTLHLGIWSNFIAQETLSEFEKSSGVRVQVSHYSSNEELLAKMQAGAGGYDVIVPTDYMVGTMAKLGLIQKLDRAKLPSFAAIDPRLLGKAYDPRSEFSVPYDSGTTGIAVNRTKYSGKISGWKDLLEAGRAKPELAGSFSLLDDSREVIGAALKALGFSLNTKDPAELQKAKQLLQRARPRVKAFTSETLAALVSGEMPVAQAYSSDALQARKATGGKIEFILPEEGGTYWIDCLAIPSKSAHPEEAHRLIEFLLQPKVGAALAEKMFVAPASREALKLLAPSFAKENAVMFPSETQLVRFEMIEDLGEALLAWDRAWTEIKAEN